MPQFLYLMKRNAYTYLNAYPIRHGTNPITDYLEFINPNYTAIEGYTVRVNGSAGILKLKNKAKDKTVALSYHMTITNNDTKEIEKEATWFNTCGNSIKQATTAFFDARFKIEDLIEEWNIDEM